MPLILGTNSIKDTAYNVANSVRLNAGDNPSGTITQGTPTNVDKYTFSVWVKRADIGASNSKIFSVTSGSTYGEEKLEFNTDDLIWRQTDTSGNTSWQRVTDRKFRDPSAWFHIVVAYDSSQGTASDRCKMYINGVQETSFSGSSNPSSGQDSYTNTNGRALKFFALYQNTNSQNAGAYFAEMVYVDGQQLDPTSFGEFDSDSPNIWKPIDVSGLTFGNNGFYLDFEDSSALGNDVSGNNNDVTFSNIASTDQSTDTCTNNYATFNSLLNTNGTLSEGNLQAQSPASGGNGGISTFGASKGKWYAEFKQVAESTANEGALAVIDTTFLHNSTLTSQYLEYSAGTYGLRDALGRVFYTSGGSNTINSSFHGNWTTNDIIGIALDIDNNRVYFSKNGQWTDGSGNWDESNPTGYVTIQSTHGEGTYMFAVGDSSSANNVTWQGNFGSPPHSITSGNSDANGYGNFEYAVPSGYYALNTKNLAEFG